MKYLKFALFTLAASIVLIVAKILTQIVYFDYVILLSILLCSGSLVVWFCNKISNKFKYSANVIVIVVFAAIAIYTAVLFPNSINISAIKDVSGLYELSVFSLITLAAILGAVVSSLVLIWKIIF